MDIDSSSLDIAGPGTYIAVDEDGGVGLVLLDSNGNVLHLKSSLGLSAPLAGVVQRVSSSNDADDSNAALNEFIEGLEAEVGRASKREMDALATFAFAGFPVSPRTAALLKCAGYVHAHQTGRFAGVPFTDAAAGLMRSSAFATVEGADNVRWMLAAADKLDGGKGANVHHGCVDVSIAVADCNECLVTGVAEADGDFYQNRFVLS